jgi:hypothetical protein
MAPEMAVLIALVRWGLKPRIRKAVRRVIFRPMALDLTQAFAGVR